MGWGACGSGNCPCISALEEESAILRVCAMAEVGMTKPSAWVGKPSIFLAALLLPFGSAAAKTAEIRAVRAPAAEAAVKALELQLCDLLVHGKWQAYASRLTDDYVRVLPGRVQNKAEVLEEFRTSKSTIISMVPKKIQTRIYGDAAIVSVDVYERERTPTGTIIEDNGRGTKVFVRRNGKWYLAQL